MTCMRPSSLECRIGTRKTYGDLVRAFSCLGKRRDKKKKKKKNQSMALEWQFKINIVIHPTVLMKHDSLSLMMPRVCKDKHTRTPTVQLDCFHPVAIRFG